MRIAQGVLISALLVSLYAYAEEKPQESSLTYRVVDTGVAIFYDNNSVIPMPKPDEEYFGQDAQYRLTHLPTLITEMELSRIM